MVQWVLIVMKTYSTKQVEAIRYLEYPIGYDGEVLTKQANFLIFTKSKEVDILPLNEPDLINLRYLYQLMGYKEKLVSVPVSGRFTSH